MTSISKPGALGSATDETARTIFAAPGVPRTKPLPKPTFFQSVKQQMGMVLLTIVNLGTFFAIWEYIAYLQVLPKIFFPAPTGIFVALWEFLLNGQLWYHTQYSLINLLVGFILSAAVGVPIGLAAGTFPRFNAIVSPYYWALYSTPRLAIWPLLVLWGGFSIQVKIILVFISAIMPILVNTIAGVSTVDPVLMRVGRVLNANRLQLYTKIVIPYTLPFILTGLTQGLSRGLVAMVVSEMLGSGRGLGYAIVRSVEEFNPARVFALLFVLIIIAMVTVNGITWISDRALPWRKQLQL